jgi:hypothetical protein
MYRNIFNKFRFNKFLRNLTLSLGYKFPNLINWKTQIKKNKKKYLNLIKNNSGKKVLIAPVVTSDQILVSLHSLIGFSLTLKGAEVNYLTCNKSIMACTNAYNFAISNKEFLKDGPSKFCNSCHDCSYTLFKPLNKNFLELNKYIDPVKIAILKKFSKQIDINKIKDFKEDGINIGEHTMAGTLRYFASGTINYKNHDQCEVLRQYFLSALIVKDSISNLLDKFNYDTVVIDHGMYIPQGIVAEVARKKGCKVKVIWVGYRRNTLMIVDDITYHKSLLTENLSNWKNLELDSEKKDKIIKYLNDRDSGKQDWEKFNKDPIQEIDILKRNKKLDNRPIISLMTNVIWDAQLKFDQNIFTNQLEWIFKTVKYFEKRNDLQLVIRVHPAEVRPDMPASQKIIDELNKKFEKLPQNVKLIDGHEKFSSYSLSKISKAVLVYATKLSFELPCFGQNVIVCGEAFAKNKGFTIDPTTEDEYFTILDNIKNIETLSRDKQDLAIKYSYHFFFRKSMEISSLITNIKSYPPFKLKDNFFEIVENNEDPAIEKICENILKEKQAFLN